MKCPVRLLWGKLISLWHWVSFAESLAEGLCFPSAGTKVCTSTPAPNFMISKQTFYWVFCLPLNTFRFPSLWSEWVVSSCLLLNLPVILRRVPRWSAIPTPGSPSSLTWERKWRARRWAGQRAAVCQHQCGGFSAQGTAVILNTPFLNFFQCFFCWHY